MISRIATDAWVRENDPGGSTTNYGSSPRLSLSNVGSDARYAYVYFPRPFPLNATILTATLRLYLRGAWGGANTITAKRITSSWTESLISWGRKPTVTATHAVTEVVTGGSAGDMVEIDISEMLQDVASGSGTFYGVRLEVNTASVRDLHSSDSATASYRPEVELTWSEKPETPDQLVPDEQVVSTGSPVLHWRFTDKVGNTQQASSQVQVASDTGFTSIVYDSTKVANDESLWDLSDDGTWDAADLPNTATLYWRVRAWDGTDYASNWSSAATLTRINKGALAVTDPGATVEETTPTVAWNLTGATQESYRVQLFRVRSNGTLVQLWIQHTYGAENDVTIPNGLIKSGYTYRVRVEVWDDEDRALNEHLTDVSDDFTYVRDGTPDPPTVLTATTDGSPAAILTWERDDAPDYWCLVVDGEEVDDRIDVGDTFVSGTEYTMKYWLSSPKVEHTYEIEAVVSTAGGPYHHSAGNPEADLTVYPIGIWLVDPDDDANVQILGREDVEMAVGESGTTYSVIGAQAPVRITDTLRGYSGSVSGYVISRSKRNTFLTLKERLTTLNLILGSVAIPVRLEEVSASPTPLPDEIYVVSFGFFQVGAPWPVENV